MKLQVTRLLLVSPFLIAAAISTALATCTAAATPTDKERLQFFLAHIGKVTDFNALKAFENTQPTITTDDQGGLVYAFQQALFVGCPTSIDYHFDKDGRLTQIILSPHEYSDPQESAWMSLISGALGEPRWLSTPHYLGRDGYVWETPTCRLFMVQSFYEDNYRSYLLIEPSPDPRETITRYVQCLHGQLELAEDTLISIHPFVEPDEATERSRLYKNSWLAGYRADVEYFVTENENIVYRVRISLAPTEPESAACSAWSQALVAALGPPSLGDLCWQTLDYTVRLQTAPLVIDIHSTDVYSYLIGHKATVDDIMRLHEREPDEQRPDLITFDEVSLAGYRGQVTYHLADGSLRQVHIVMFTDKSNPWRDPARIVDNLRSIMPEMPDEPTRILTDQGWGMTWETDATEVSVFYLGPEDPEANKRELLGQWIHVLFTARGEPKAPRVTQGRDSTQFRNATWEMQRGLVRRTERQEPFSGSDKYLRYMGTLNGYDVTYGFRFVDDVLTGGYYRLSEDLYPVDTTAADEGWYNESEAGSKDTVRFEHAAELLEYFRRFASLLQLLERKYGPASIMWWRADIFGDWGIVSEGRPWKLEELINGNEEDAVERISEVAQAEMIRLSSSWVTDDTIITLYMAADQGFHDECDVWILYNSYKVVQPAAEDIDLVRGPTTWVSST